MKINNINLLRIKNKYFNLKKSYHIISIYSYILILPITLLVSGYSFGQSNNTIMIVDYDMDLEFKKYPYYKARLLFDNESSIYTYKSKQLLDQEDKDNRGNLSIAIADKTKYTIYSEQNLKNTYEIQSNVSAYGVLDQKKIIKWEFIKDTTKTIGNYKCNLAKAKVKGRTYYSWYTLEIPSNLGPWKLNGLPGLILQAYDINKRVSFSVTKISRLKKRELSIPKSKFKWVTRKEFNKMQIKKVEKIMARMAAKNSRGDKSSFKVNLGEQIEIE